MIGTAVALPGWMAACGRAEEELPQVVDAPDEGPDSDAQVPADALVLAGANSLSGTFAEIGRDTERGNRLAVEETGGELLGRELSYRSLDTQGDVNEAVRRVREELERGTRYFTGVSLSSVALALSDEIDRAGGVFTTGVGADEVTGEECRRSTFRWSVATYGAVHETVRPLLDQNDGLQRWYTITPDYVFGEALLTHTRDLLEERGAELIGNDYHSLDESEFSPYVTNALAANPDVLCILNFGEQSSRTLRQAVEFGAKERTTILLVWSAGLTQFEGLGADIMDGVYAGGQYWHTVDTPLNRELVDMARAEYGVPPSYPLAAGYINGKLMLDAMEETGSAEPRDVIEALEGREYEGPTGPESIRAGDHQVIKNYYLLLGKSPDAMQDEHDFVDIVSEGQTAIPEEESGCDFGD